MLIFSKASVTPLSEGTQAQRELKVRLAAFKNALVFDSVGRGSKLD